AGHSLGERSEAPKTNSTSTNQPAPVNGAKSIRFLHVLTPVGSARPASGRSAGPTCRNFWLDIVEVGPEAFSKEMVLNRANDSDEGGLPTEQEETTSEVCFQFIAFSSWFSFLNYLSAINQMACHPCYLFVS